MRSYLISLSLLACLSGCAGTRSSAVSYGALPPPRAHQREMRLRRALVRALDRQEAEDGLRLRCYDDACVETLDRFGYTVLVCD